MTIQAVRPSDAALLRDLHVRMYTDAPGAFGETVAEAQARSDEEWGRLAERLALAAEAIGFVAYEGAEPCGFVYSDLADPRIPPNTALVGHLWVDPRMRRMGIGQALMNAV